MKPTANQISDKYEYSQEGYLVYRVDSGRYGRYKAGTRAGSTNSQGARMVRVEGKEYQEHQLIWCLVNGEWPQRVIRHIDGDLLNNRIENLSMDSEARGNKGLPLTIDRLREVLEYDPEAGVFKWKISPRNRTLPGDIAGRKNSNGYMIVTVDKQTVRLHRVAWAVTHGRWPEADIDHINGVRDDNRIENLREATRGQNCQNTARRTDNRTGSKGVHFRKDTGKYSASITVDGKTIYLGSFCTLEEARMAREQEEIKLHSYRRTNS